MYVLTFLFILIKLLIFVTGFYVMLCCAMYDYLCMLFLLIIKVQKYNFFSLFSFVKIANSVIRVLHVFFST